MRVNSVAKIAIGTALGILLIVVGGSVALGVGDVTPAASVSDRAPTQPTPDAGDDGRSDAGDVDAEATDTRPAELKAQSAGSDEKKRHATTPKPRLTSCDANIRVKSSTTSCPFAQNVFLAYWMDHDSPGVFADSSGLPAYSPAADTTFTVDCAGDPVVCKAEDGGYVTFPMSAVEAYTMRDAKRYVATHDTGGVDPSDANSSAAPPDEPQSPESDCDPNYAGACLDPNSSDYDCEGGTGDGPDYTGTVEVVGDDPYDLDRDGNGIACEA
jgi:hypothetical protein